MLLNDKEITALCMNINFDEPTNPSIPASQRQVSYEYKSEEESMIFPFIPANVGSIPVTVAGEGPTVSFNEKVVSYGVSSFGYDTRLADSFNIFTPTIPGAFPIIDPKQPDERYFVKHRGDYAIIPPNSFLLGHTIEYFRIPQDILVICLGKSTYARCGLIVNVTPLEPGWCGQITIEISNTTPLPAKVYANEGIAQLLFLKGNRPARTYSDKKGKYMGQTGVVPARM